MPSRATSPLACLTLVALSGCAHSIQLRAAEPPPELAVEAIAVYPARFTWDEPGYRSLEVAQRQVGVLLRDPRIAVVGPSELRISSWEEEPIRGSDVGALVLGSGIDVRRFVVLRLLVDQRVARSQQVVLDASGKAVGATRNEERSLLVRLDVIHPGSRRSLFVLEAQAPVDSFDADRPEWDPLPELTTLAEELTQRALELLDGLDALRGAELSLGFRWAPAVLGSFGLSPDALATETAKLDPLETELLVDGRVRYGAPGADDATIRRLMKARRGGLLVLEADEEAGGLAAGDLVISAGGAPLAGPQVLLRRLRRVRAGATLELEVERDGAPRTVLLKRQ